MEPDALSNAAILTSKNWWHKCEADSAFKACPQGCLTGSTGHPRAVWRRPEGVELRAGKRHQRHPHARGPGSISFALPGSMARHESVDAAIPAAILFIVAVTVGIGAALLGYRMWAIPPHRILALAAPSLRLECLRHIRRSSGSGRHGFDASSAAAANPLRASADR